MSVAMRYAGSAAVVAAASGLAGVALVAAAGGPAAWGAAGWAAMALVGVAGGGWLASQHGGRGAGFFLAFGAGMLARLVAAGASLAAALAEGARAPWACLVGLAAGYVPLQVHELVWFWRRGEGADLRGGR